MCRLFQIILIQLLIIGSLCGQGNHLNDLAEVYDNDSFSRYVFRGFLEKSLPVELVFGKEGEEIKGFIYYGDNEDRYDVEGTINAAGDIVLYEFDHHQRVSGKILGNILKTTELFTWHSPDGTLSLSLLLFPNKPPRKVLDLFVSNIENSRSQILLREDLQQITIDPIGDVNLRWIDFLCQGTDCYENRPNVQLSNPVEFSLDIKDQKELKVYPSHKYTEVQVMEYDNKSQHRFKGFTSINFPVLQDEVFDDWIQSTLLANKIQKNTDDDYQSIALRFSDRSFGDFYISLISKDLISGYLYLQNTESNKVKTIPFIFDRSKSRFYQIQDIFSKSFDYSFFIEKYLEKVKRGRLIKENRLVQNLLKKEDYNHYILAPEGILFFTDFNVIYGRRHILIKYDEVMSSIDNKALENYLKKERS